MPQKRKHGAREDPHLGWEVRGHLPEGVCQGLKDVKRFSRWTGDTERGLGSTALSDCGGVRGALVSLAPVPGPVVACWLVRVSVPSAW